jgi:hypothetical protein
VIKVPALSRVAVRSVSTVEHSHETAPRSALKPPVLSAEITGDITAPRSAHRPTAAPYGGWPPTFGNYSKPVPSDPA